MSGVVERLKEAVRILQKYRAEPETSGGMFTLKNLWRISLLVYWLRRLRRLLAPNAGGPGLIPDQETRSHMPQLSVHML